MSNPYLPPEILNHIINLVRNGQALRECCLVFKLWVLCTRRRLFTDIKFHPACCLESWKKTVPDPADSLTYNTHVPWVGCPQAVKVVDAEEGGWIRAFSHVVVLYVDSYRTEPRWLVPSGPRSVISPVPKSLRVFSASFPNSRIFDLVLSKGSNRRVVLCWG